jgi:competence protein ComEC
MRLWKNIFILLVLIFSLIIISISQIPDGRLHLVVCDVGQGDATLLIYKNIQILTDGGPDRSVLNCLGKHMPFWDREIELVVLTHPDKDHFQGLLDVFRRYKVMNYLNNPVTISKPEYRVLEKVVGGHGTKSLYPHAGQVMRVGMIHLDILAPLQQINSGSNDSQPPSEIRQMTIR